MIVQSRNGMALARQMVTMLAAAARQDVRLMAVLAFLRMVVGLTPSDNSRAVSLTRTVLAAALLALLATPMVAPSAAARASVTLDFNLDPFFDSLNQYLPVFIGLFAVIGGIAGAMALSNYVIGKVVKAFSGTV